jgi:hypothetical protein
MQRLKSKKNRFYNGTVKTAEIPLKDGNVNTIIQWMVDTHLVEWYVTYLLKKTLDDEDVEDKIQDIYLMILEIPQEKWDDLFEQGQFSVSGYITGIIHQQIKSGNSRIYRDYNKYHERNKRMDDDFWKIYYNDGEKEK